MEYSNLGRSGLKVSTLCLGTMTFGEADANSFMHNVGSDAATAHAIMNKALDSGVNFWDTADVYGQDGLSERVIGDWFASTGKRDQVVLATKCRFRMDAGPNGGGAARLRIVRCVDDSLRRLKTDRIDLYQIHAQDMDVPEQESLRALDDLVRAGKVVYIGASNYAAYRLTESVMLSEMRGWEHFVALQAQYSLVVRDLEREHVPMCSKFGLGILPWSPLASGFLSGKYRQGQGAPAGSRLESSKWTSTFKRFDTPRNWAILQALDDVAQQLSSTASAVALAWLLRKQAVTSVIFGARTLGQLDDNLTAASLQLSDAQMKTLNDASAFELGYPYDFLQRTGAGRW